MKTKVLPIDKVVFRKDLYPRLETSTTTVQKYAEDPDVLPDIEVNQRDELIDGWHRLTARKKRGDSEISVVVTETTSDEHLLELAIRRNATHGLSLSLHDKEDMAHRIYNGTPVKDREAKKKELESILSVSERSIRNWLKRIDKDTKEKQRRQVFDLWLSCRSQEEIASELSWSQQAVAKFQKGFTTNGNFAVCGKTDENDEDEEEEPKEFKLTKAQLASAEHATDFKIPVYNVWKQQEKSEGAEHFGNTEINLLDNLLYLYTSMFDLVIDPFAGGGSTIDLCRKRLRRYWASDRKPNVESSSEGVPLYQQIRQWDVTEGLPQLPQWKEVKLVYLDPPYWKQAEGRYSKDPEDLANMPLEKFNDVLAGLIKKFAAKLSATKSKDSRIALVMQPTQWNAPGRQFTDHVGDMLRMVKLPVDMRISTPYESQQCNAQMVQWAKENRKVLVLSREIVVWRVD